MFKTSLSVVLFTRPWLGIFSVAVLWGSFARAAEGISASWAIASKEGFLSGTSGLIQKGEFTQASIFDQDHMIGVGDKGPIYLQASTQNGITKAVLAFNGERFYGKRGLVTISFEGESDRRSGSLAMLNPQRVTIECGSERIQLENPRGYVFLGYSDSGSEMAQSPETSRPMQVAQANPRF